MTPIEVSVLAIGGRGGFPRWLGHAGIAALFLLLAVWATWPLVINSADHIPVKATGDQLWQAAILEGQYRDLRLNPQNFLDGYFYYGSGRALFASDLLIGLFLIFAPLRFVSGNPLLAFNVTWILAFALNAMAMYAATLAFTRSRAAAVVAGLIYAFGPIALNFARSHFQLAGAWWIPLALYFCLKAVENRDWKRLLAAAFCVWLQFVTAAQLGIVAGLIFGLFGVVPMAWQSVRTLNWRWAVGTVAVVSIAIALVLPVAVGYSLLARDWGVSRHITEVQQLSVQMRDYLSPPATLRWYGNLRDRFPVPTGERRVFPGFVPVATALSGAILILFARGPDRKLKAVGLAAVGAGAIGVLFSLGTHWKWHETASDIELPYLFFFEQVPGFQSIRAVARFALLTNLAAAILSAAGVALLLRRFISSPLAKGLAGVAIAGAIVVESWPSPLATHSVINEQGLRDALKSMQPGPTLFLPIGGGEEVRRTWLVTTTGEFRLVNGYSGFIWPQYWFFRDVTEDIPPQEADSLAMALHAYGVRNIVIEKEMLADPESPNWQALAKAPVVEKATDLGRWQLLSLSRESTSRAQRWQDVEVRLLLESVLPDYGMTVALSIANRTATPWLPPHGSKVRQATAYWLSDGGRVELRQKLNLRPPPFVIAGGSHSTLIHLFTPSRPGNYRLKIEVDDETLIEQPIAVEQTTYRRFDGTGTGLRAKLTLISQQQLQGLPVERYALHVDALNVGDVVWSGDANIRLGWIWYLVLENGQLQEMPKYEGRIPVLGHETGEIVPGNGYSFRGRLRAPDEPGNYIVRISMVSELVAWFESDPVEVHVTAQNRP